ncbi:MAG: hypothetical protein ACRD3W_20615, partial [Terriglobales bacterium]
MLNTGAMFKLPTALSKRRFVFAAACLTLSCGTDLIRSARAEPDGQQPGAAPESKTAQALAYLKKGLEHFIMGRMADARNDLQAAARINPNIKNVQFLQVYVDFGLQDFRACVRDTSCWLDGSTWQLHEAPYVVMLGVLARKSLGDENAAQKLLSEGLSQCSRAWPYPLLSYMNGGIDLEALRESAATNPQQTDFKFYTALFKSASHPASA